MAWKISQPGRVREARVINAMKKRPAGRRKYSVDRYQTSGRVHMGCTGHDIQYMIDMTNHQHHLVLDP